MSKVRDICVFLADTTQQNKDQSRDSTSQSGDIVSTVRDICVFWADTTQQGIEADRGIRHLNRGI